MSPSAGPRGFLWHPALHALIILAFALIAYSNSLDVPFQFDDKANITENPLIKDFRYFTDLPREEDVPMRYFYRFKNRIVGYFTLALNYRAHGLDVRGYHVVNLAFHIINALLVYWLVTLSFRTPSLQASSLSDKSGLVALLSALLFISHPVQTQAVTFVVQRLASLTTLFCALSLILYVRFRFSSGVKRVLLYSLSVFSAALAMKTKEIAFTLPVIVALYDAVFLSGPVKKRLLYLLPVFLTMLIIPLGVLGSGASLADILGDIGEQTRLRGTDITRPDYLFTEFRVIVTYLRLLALPINQNLDYDYPVFHSLSSPQVLLSFLFLVLAFAGGIRLMYASKKHDPALRLAGFGILWFFITLSVESSIIPIEDVIFEHRLYLPSVGIFIATGTTALLALYGFSDARLRLAGAAVIACVVLLFSAAAHERNSIWQSRLGLWADVLEKSPKKARAHNNMASAFEAAEDFEKALEHYETAARLDPGSAPIQNNLANAYASNGMFGKAIERFSLAVELDPGYIQAYNDLGSAFYAMGQTEKAIELYMRVIGMSPDFIDSYINLGIIHNGMGRPDRAAEYLKHVVDIRPDIAPAHYNLANSYAAMSRYEDAIREYSAALALDPGNVTAHYNIGNAYLAAGMSESATEHYKAAIMLKPDYTEAYVNLGLAYKKAGRMDMAIEYYGKALSVGPDNADAHYNLANAYMQQGRTDEAISHYETAIALRPDDPGAHHNLAIAYRQKGIFGKAREHLEIAEQLRLKTGPDN